MYTFIVDPRVCLVTGKKLDKGHHSCCGIEYDYIYKLQTGIDGLSVDYQNKMRHTQYRTQLMNESEPDSVHLSNFIKLKHQEKSSAACSVKRLFRLTIKERLLQLMGLFAPARLLKSVRTFTLI